MTIELAPALLSDQKVIENLWPLYVYDMSEYTGWGPSAEGRYDDGRPPLDDYWKRDDHEPYLIRCEGELAGFSMLRRYPGARDFGTSVNSSCCGSSNAAVWAERRSASPSPKNRAAG